MTETYLEQIKKARPQILTGEIGALLHDIGKCHPDFVKKQSLEGGKDFEHSAIDGFLKLELTSLLKDDKFSFNNIDSENSHIYSLITEHHNRGTSNCLIKLLQGCDRFDSADDKGIVRKKQSIDKTIISSPFGCTKEKINPACLEVLLNELEERLIGILKDYLAGRISLEQLRKLITDNLRVTFLHALGETRIPANDVTLWDHSYSTASLYKAVLCGIVLGKKPELQDLKWRIFGISWDGLGFMEKGKKVADILKRKQIIEEIKEELKTQFEVVYPLGNAVYEDINGVFFTFPALEKEKAKELAEECVEKFGWDIVLEISNRELWPFFTLSYARRSLTILGQELKIATEKRNIPRMSPILFIEGKEELLDIDWLKLLPEGDENREGYDVCPACQIRCKEHWKEICETCDERRRGRLDKWLQGAREETIWIDEVADENNRVALLTLSFGLDKWLDGTLVGTIYSQTFDDWLYGKKEKKFNEILDTFKNEITKEIEKISKAIEGMNKATDKSRVEAKIKEKNKEKWELEKQLEKLEVPLGPTKETALCFVNKFLELKDTDKGKEKAAKILDTFFEDFNVSREEKKDGQDNPLYFKNVWDNLKLKLPDEKPETVLSALFTQNPSPARLSRIWQETEDFWAETLQRLAEPEAKWQRIQFAVDIAKLKAAEKTPYILKFKNLEPDTLLVLHIDNGKFFTIESLGKFKTDGAQGAAAVEKALKEKGFYHFALEEAPGNNLLGLDKDEVVKAEKADTEKYYPFIEVIRTPLLFQVIIPALEAVKILNMIDDLFSKRFEKVTGKLPLNAGLLVANRKFPLYLLLDAGRRVLRDRGFKEQVFLDPWWDISRGRNDKFYGFYPLKKLEQSEKPEEEKDNNYTLDELAPLSKGRSYALYTGYFDFDLLRGNEDRYKLAYEGKRRTHKDYKLFSARPCYLYQFKQMVDLWEIITNNPSPSQINFIEQAITLKIGEWRNVEDPSKKEVLQAYMEAVLREAFGEKWSKLSEETRCFILNSVKNNLLLDTIVLFRHVIKEKGGM
ncbi:MAG: CRISPR-associated protein Csx11 [Peptococcaceae bacterium]